jgi:DNA-binding winged helix-turn-helix (wHTH) protein/tetratricopeptide (TPR) repeat protein/TolB-like protein
MSLGLTLKEPQINLGTVKSPDHLIYEFHNFRLDAVHLMLYKGDEEVALTPKQVETLLALVEKNGEIVSKDVLMERLWGDTVVEEANLVQNIHFLRKELGNAPDGRPMIETRRRRGYRFSADLKSSENGTVWLRRPDESPVVERPWFEQRPVAISLAFIGLLGLVIIASSFLFSSPPPTTGRVHFAVLPMQPIDSSNRNELYEVGVADLLIYRLNSINGFVVRPLSATRRYSAIDQDALAAGRDQRVDRVLASNYQIAEGKVRITAQLIDVATGAVDGNYFVETDANNILASQTIAADQIVEQLISHFNRTPGTTTAKRGTNNEEAYRLYIQGRNLTMKRNRDDNRKAVAYFEQAIALDPNFALAYARMAGAYYDSNFENDKAATVKVVNEIVKKALELDPNSAEAYVSRGTVSLIYDWHFKAAEKDFLRAIELEPNNDTAHWMMAMLLSARGQFDEALREIETAQAIDPGAVVYMFHRGRILYYARRYDEAITQLNQAIDIDDRFIQPYGSIVRVYEMQGDYDTAFKYFLKREERSSRKDRLEKYKKDYETGGWLALRRNNTDSGNSLFDMARLYAQRGEIDPAFDYLEKCIDEKEWLIGTLMVEPALDNLRADPRFDALMKRLAFDRG